jgi:hypothetical protein
MHHIEELKIAVSVCRCKAHTYLLKIRDVQQRIMKQPILQTVKDEESVG